MGVVFIAADLCEDYEDFKFKRRPENFILMRTMRSQKTGLMQLKQVSENYEEYEFRRQVVGMAAHLSEDYEDFKFKTGPYNFILVRTMRSLNSRVGWYSLLHIFVRTMRTSNSREGLRIAKPQTHLYLPHRLVVDFTIDGPT